MGSEWPLLVGADEEFVPQAEGHDDDAQVDVDSGGEDEARARDVEPLLEALAERDLPTGAATALGCGLRGSRWRSRRPKARRLADAHRGLAASSRQCGRAS